MTNTFFIECEAVPSEKHADFDRIGGAFACFYLLAEDHEEARVKCRAELAKDHWLIVEENRISQVDRSELMGNVDALERFDLSQKDGLCYTAHAWPLKADDEDEIH